MKSFIVVGLLTLSNALAMGDVQSVNRSIDLEEGFPIVEQVETPDSVYAELACMEEHQGDFAAEADEVSFDDIVNLGDKAWKVIQDNKAVVETKSTFASALPRGVRSAGDLDGFTEPQFKSFRMHGKNGFGATVYDVTYTLVHRYNGTYEGKGKYLENVTVLPHKVSALWGYTVNMNVSNVSSVNVGTKDAPVGSVLMQMQVKVSTLVKSSDYQNVFEFRGDSPAVRSIQAQF